ncbi:DUF4174 domain-containing protein [uncultured Litoreibacter sp.]|uniref:DUF4174 domain-containing protein n=1 Tax=uncultured Litoreibacter sp. TaxID=1392394 RepID=UPI0026296FDE|nr:DUF4174 domain-containing protein [uncultured Litoreibacter sp.]
MKHTLIFVFTAFSVVAAAFSGMAQTTSEDGDDMAPKDVIELNLNDFLWEKRPIVVFADTDRDPAFVRQLELLEARTDALSERDVVILTDTDPSKLSPLRKQLRPRGFMLVLIGKDGDVKLRKPFPWSVRELSRAIDKMPMRQQEIRDRKAAASSTDG